MTDPAVGALFGALGFSDRIAGTAYGVYGSAANNGYGTYGTAGGGGSGMGRSRNESTFQMGTNNNPIGVYGKSIRIVKDRVMKGEAPKDLFDEVARDPFSCSSS